MDDELRQRLAELGEIAATLDPSTGEDQESAARIEAYREGIRFAVAFIEDDGFVENEVENGVENGDAPAAPDADLEPDNLPQIPLPREE